MDNRLKLYVFLLILIFVGIAFFEVNRPKEIDWQPYYTTAKKSPYGLYILNKEIGKIFKNQKIEKLNETPYEFFDNSFDYDSSVFNYSKKGTYFSIEKDNVLDRPKPLVQSPWQLDLGHFQSLCDLAQQFLQCAERA